MIITILCQLAKVLYEKPVIDVPLKVALSRNTEFYLNEKMRDRDCILYFPLDYNDHI